jgi:hypothetical protein
MKKTLLGLTLASATLVGALVVSADTTSQSTNLKYTPSAATYTLTIPSAVDLTEQTDGSVTGSGVIKLSKENLLTDMELIVGITNRTSLLADNQTDGTYTIKNAGTTVNDGDTVLTFNAGTESFDPNVGKSTTLDFAVVNGRKGISTTDDHTATVTFGVSLVNPSQVVLTTKGMTVQNIGDTVNFIGVNANTTTTYRVEKLDGNGHALIVMEGDKLRTSTYGQAANSIDMWWDMTARDSALRSLALPTTYETLDGATTVATSGIASPFLPSADDIRTIPYYNARTWNPADQLDSWLRSSNSASPSVVSGQYGDGQNAVYSTTGGDSTTYAVRPAFWVNI